MPLHKRVTVSYFCVHPVLICTMTCLFLWLFAGVRHEQMLHRMMRQELP